MKPTKVLFIDAYCASHVGNDVLLESGIALVKKICLCADIAIHARQSDSFKKTQGVTCGQTLFYDAPVGGSAPAKLIWLFRTAAFIGTQILNGVTLRLPPHLLSISKVRRKALKDYSDSNLIISIGGEMINDSFRKTLPMYLFMFWLAGRFGAKVVIFPQSIGPLRRHWTRRLTAIVLNKCTIVTARDQPSLDELYSLGFSGNQVLTSPDVGIEQSIASHGEAQEYLAELGVVVEGDRVWIGVTPSAWVEEQVIKKSYLETLVNAIKQVAFKHKIGVLLMPANMPVHGDNSTDYDAAMLLFSQLEHCCPTHILRKEVIPARMFKAITQQLNLFVSTRMHASILSTMAGTPTITINTQRKLYGYMKRIGQERFSLDIQDMTETKIADAVEEVMNNTDKVRDELRQGYVNVSAELAGYVDTVRPIIGC